MIISGFWRGSTPNFSYTCLLLYSQAKQWLQASRLCGSVTGTNKTAPWSESSVNDEYYTWKHLRKHSESDCNITVSMYSTWILCLKRLVTFTKSIGGDLLGETRIFRLKLVVLDFFCCNKCHDHKQLREEKDFFLLTLSDIKQSITVRKLGRNLEGGSEHRPQECCLLAFSPWTAHLLSSTTQAYKPRSTIVPCGPKAHLH